MWRGSAHVGPIVLVFIGLEVAFQMCFIALIVYLVGNSDQSDQVEWLTWRPECRLVHPLDGVRQDGRHEDWVYTRDLVNRATKAYSWAHQNQRSRCQSSPVPISTNISTDLGCKSINNPR